MELAWQKLAAQLFVAALVTGFLGGVLFSWAWGMGCGIGADLAARLLHRYNVWCWERGPESAGLRRRQEKPAPASNEEPAT